MNSGPSLDTGFAKESYKAAIALNRAAAAKQQPQDNIITRQEEERDSGLQWQEIQNKGTGEFSLASGPSAAAVVTTVAAPETIKAAPSAQLSVRANLKEKFTGLLEQNYAGCFSHNRLVAKVSEWVVGNVMERLAMLGMSAQELAEIRGRVRENVIEQNGTALAQVVYDETMMEIVA